MSLDKELREAFMRHATDVEPREDAWQREETKIKRAYARRASIVGSLSAIVLIAGALLVPKLVSERTAPAPGFATGVPTTPADPDTEDWVGRAAVELGFSVKIPQDWRGGWFEGRWDFHPKGLPGINEGGETFTVEIHSATFKGGPFDDLERETTSSKATIAGFEFERRETVDDGPKLVYYAGNWTYPEDQYLLIQLYGSDDALFTEHVETGEAIAQSVSPYDGSEPVHGQLSDTTPVDAYTKALVRFMDARVEGIGADELVCCDAQEKYGETLYTATNGDYVAWHDPGCTREEGAATAAMCVGLAVQDGMMGTDRNEKITLGYESGTTGDGPVKILDFIETGDGP